MTGVFAGDLEAAHLQAYRFLKAYVTVPVEESYDIVVSHGGHVGINHYQSVKAGLAALPAVTEGGTLIIMAANTDTDPVGSMRYRSLLHLLKMTGPEGFRRLIFSPDWTFVPEQWEVQAWARVFDAAPPERFVYYSPHLGQSDYEIIPGTDGNRYLPEQRRYRPEMRNMSIFLQSAVSSIRSDYVRRGKDNPRIAFLADGPYGILSRDTQT